MTKHPPIPDNFLQTGHRFKDYETAMKFQRTGDYSLCIPMKIGDKINPEWEEARYELGLILSPYAAEKLSVVKN